MENFDNTMKLTKEKEDEQLIKNIEIKKFIQFKLDKKEITKESLDSIDEILLDGKNIVGQYNKVYFEEIDLFQNLERIVIKNLGVTSKNIQKLANIRQVEFENCEVENIKAINKVQHLSLINSEMESMEEIEQLCNVTELELINMNIDSFEFLKKLEYLKKLKIKNINNFNLEKINFFLPIEYLSIEKIEQLDLNIIFQYKKLKTLSVDRKEAEKWKNELENIKSKGIEILLNDIYEY